MKQKISADDQIEPESLTRAFSTLADARRRRVVEHLMGQPSSTVSTLADQVAEREHDEPLEEIDDDEIDAVRVSLHHLHLPRLEDAGYVEYDPDDCEVEFLDTPSTQMVQSILQGV